MSHLEVRCSQPCPEAASVVFILRLTHLGTLVTGKITRILRISVAPFVFLVARVAAVRI
jgi:hypothetical protein